MLIKLIKKIILGEENDAIVFETPKGISSLSVTKLMVKHIDSDSKFIIDNNATKDKLEGIIYTYKLSKFKEEFNLNTFNENIADQVFKRQVKEENTIE